MKVSIVLIKFSLLLLFSVPIVSSKSRHHKNILSQVDSEQEGDTDSNRIVCYYASWALYRPGDGSYDPEDIEPFYCTHLVYAYAGIDAKAFTIRSIDPYIDLKEYQNGYGRTVALQKVNPDLKVLLGVGGYNEDSATISEMVSDTVKRSTFISSIVELVNQYGFNGVEFDWEFPGARGGSMTDYNYFPLFLREMREEFDKYDWTLGIAVGTTPDVLPFYNIAEISNYVHFINLMTYDFRGYWNGITGHHTQLFDNPNSDSSDPYLLYNVETAISNWTTEAPASKLNLGFAFFGRTFTSEENKGQLDFTCQGPGNAGIYTQSAGFVGYNELCLMMENEGDWWKDVQSYTASPIAWKNDQLIAYDSDNSIKLKSQFAKDKGLGGAMVWSIDMDDSTGSCGEKNLLLKTLNSEWFGSVPATAKSTNIDIQITCIPGSYKSNANDCSMYYLCGISNDGTSVWIEKTCSSEYYFNINVGLCEKASADNDCLMAKV